ncbi:MAG: hypothetical protein IKG23_02495 [Clostridia bacterium]|nr:hypothetical protein [Clostridia bacterium]
MKKLFCYIIAIILMISSLLLTITFSKADPELVQDETAFLASASPADLLNLRNQINNILINSPEYESVPVPAGLYVVGEDIPEGKWTLSSSVRTSMTIGTKLEENGQEIAAYGSSFYASSNTLHFLYGYLFSDNKIINTLQQTVDLPTGCYIVIDNGTVNFTTYTGKPDFLYYAKKLPDTTVKIQLDLSTYSFDNLITLKNKLNLSIWNSYSWDRIIVPAELYQIGSDIPEGKWTISSPENYTRIAYGTKLYDENMSLSIYDDWEKEIKNPNYTSYKTDEDVTSIDLTTTNGAYLAINENTCAAFSPISGKKQSLGFKKYATEETSKTDNDPTAAVYLFTLNNDNDFNSATIPGSITAGGNPAAIQKIIFNDVEYELIDYEDAERNPNNNKGKKIYFLGNVIQVSESTYDSTTTYRVKIDGSDNIVYVTKNTKTEPRVLKDDHVIVCGTCTGVESYHSLLGGTITIPGCSADDISDANNLYNRIPKPVRKNDPIVITSCSPGEDPSFSVINNSEKTTKEIGFRCKYYDENGEIMLLDDSNALNEESLRYNCSTMGTTIDIVPTQTCHFNSNEVIAFQKATYVEIALQYVTFEDDSTYFVPESSLYWFSSLTNGFINKDQPPYNYIYPSQEIFDKAKPFKLGIYDCHVFPEYLSKYGLSDTGYFIYKFTDNSILKALGVETGDIIIACDGTTYSDDPYLIDRGKAKLAEGTSIELTLSRNGEKYTITVTSEMAEEAIKLNNL